MYRMFNGRGPSLDPDRLDAVFDCMGQPVRRHVLTTLRDHRGDMTLTDLADEVAQAMRDRPLAEPSEPTAARMGIELYHKHVPKLVAADLVQYEGEDRTLRLNELEPSVEQLLATVR